MEDDLRGFAERSDHTEVLRLSSSHLALEKARTDED